ncbi:MAG: UTP--glucose-1-phosphate uridylyltransferase GalU [Lachnospiraceae bacterium]|jgi:UTP--glucose-1-phosphate uridylyltransferase|nr:UTP--glucose-1-phosphate uridylyltransferase GalU [Lachnospiraceae bacterium]
MRVRKAIIPAAGLGTRFLPATKAQAKEMLPIVDKPTIQYIIEEAVAADIEDIIIVTGRNKKTIEDHFDRSPELEMELEKAGKTDYLEMVKDIAGIANVYYVRQKEPKGLGHAILAAKSFIGNEPFAVLLGDDVVCSQTPCLGQLKEVYDRLQGSVLGVQTVAHENVCKYGIVDGVQIEDRLYEVKDMVEKPPVDKAPTDVAILGRYIINPEVFDYLETQEKGAGGEIQLTDALRRMTKDGKPMYAYDFKGTRYDVGSQIGFVEANIEYALRDDRLKGELSEYIKKLSADIEGTIHFD